jgi:hypothetical protein
VKYNRPLLVIAICLVINCGTGSSVLAQVYRIGAGLNFTSGVDFNSIPIGNPGLRVKTWIALDRLSTIHIVPSLSAFNLNTLDAGYYSITIYSFMGDLDGQYLIFKDRTVSIVAFAGANFTYLNSVVKQTDPKYPIPEHAPGDIADYGIGANLGAGLELRMAPQFDMNVSVKYILSKYSQFIISVEGVYYFKTRRRLRR